MPSQFTEDPSTLSPVRKIVKAAIDRAKGLEHTPPKPAPGSQSKPAPNPLERSLYYRLRLDALAVTAQIAHKPNGEPLSTDMYAKRLVWVEARLIESLLCDPEISQAQKSLLVEYHNDNIRNRLDERRHARNRKAQQC